MQGHSQCSKDWNIIMENINHTAILASPLGPIGIRTKNNHLTHIDFLPATTVLIEPEDKFTKKISNQLQAYFANARYEFTIPLNLIGTPFQQKVWQALHTIPAGDALSYGNLAKALDTGPRALGNACRRNPIPIIVPCHRIVASTHLGGYSGAISGDTLAIKMWLLKHEGYHFF